MSVTSFIVGHLYECVEYPYSIYLCVRTPQQKLFLINLSNSGLTYYGDPLPHASLVLDFGEYFHHLGPGEFQISRSPSLDRSYVITQRRINP